MKNTMFAALAAALMAAAPALAENYVSASVSNATQDLQLRKINPQNVNVALGRDYGDVRVEAQYSLFGDIQTRGVRANIVGVNAFYEPISIANLTPYVGAGVGYAFTGGKAVRSQDQTGFVYNLTAGASYKVNDNWALTADYRYINSADISVVRKNGRVGSLEDQSVSVGLRRSF